MNDCEPLTKEQCATLAQCDDATLARWQILFDEDKWPDDFPYPGSPETPDRFRFMNWIGFELGRRLGLVRPRRKQGTE